VPKVLWDASRTLHVLEKPTLIGKDYIYILKREKYIIKKIKKKNKIKKP
jgi:hypothetical protein